MPQPVIAQIAGIDSNPRFLSTEEVEGLTDWFGQYLANTPVEERKLSFRSLLTQALPAGCYNIYAVADGIPIVYDKARPNNPLNSVSRNLRFIVIALPDNPEGAKLEIGQAILARTLCIVGSANPNGTAVFLQCASWDPVGLDKERKLGIMRFYQRLNKDWVYSGDSRNAFNASSIDRGPFDGHIGGALIMKELTRPWTHWLDNNREVFIASLGSEPNKPSKCDRYNTLHDPLFSGPNGPPFSKIVGAESLEPIIELSVTKWYNSRFTLDLLDDNLKALPEITTVRDWVSHVLLNRSTNIATSTTSKSGVEAKLNTNLNGMPTTLFFNLNGFQRFLPDAGPEAGFLVNSEVYASAVQTLESNLYYPDPKTGEPTLAVKGSEGPFAFPIIEPGVEDYQGLKTMASKATLATILPLKAMAAMLMVDFYNPIYSARREGLMRYVPETAKLKDDERTYDVLDQFVANVSASAAAETSGSAEHEILQLLATPNDEYVGVFTDRINTYLQSVADRLSNNDTKKAAVEEYLGLADSRRRLYRGRENQKPTGGLNEFMLTLPISMLSQSLPLMKMTEDATVTAMTDEEMDYFKKKDKKKQRAINNVYSNIGGMIGGIMGCPVMLSERASTEMNELIM